MKAPALVTYRDTLALAVLIRAGKKDLADGMAFSGLTQPSFPVVVIRNDTLAKQVMLSVDKQAWERTIGVFQLRDAHDHADESAARKAVRKVFEIPEKLGQVIEYQKSGHILSAGEFTKSMESARLILWVRLRTPGLAERLEPGILVDDLQTALFVRCALRDLRTCPCCDTIFLPERPDQLYCSIRCRERFRKRRLRARKK